jgi:hypothetical protein
MTFTLPGALAVLGSASTDHARELRAWQQLADQLAFDPGCLDTVPDGIAIESTVGRLIDVGAIRKPGVPCTTCPHQARFK